ncbi:MAG: DUF1491 family protein [Pseudomonadota bacterium]
MMRLRSDIQVAAIGRQAEAVGLIYTVIHKGHAEGGMIFVKWLDGRDVFAFAETQADGVLGWRRMTPEPVPEPEADRLFEQERSFDPDLWVIEVVGSARHQEAILTPIVSA